ncbi:hypothetical protein ACIQGT_26185 [Streptomyces sp. NPDC093108]|uniref:hypothetical protein n=1 Tax=Streptomyces sp. NPDC093108 TaxID=3366030 RepID=UPI0037F91D4E
MEDIEAEDIAAMREEGDLPAFMRLRIRPDRALVQVVALWQRFPAPAGHTVGAWPSATPLDANRRRAGGEAALCDCPRCRALGAPCEADPCCCPLCGAPRGTAA